jgi:hypothetical protein
VFVCLQNGVKRIVSFITVVEKDFVEVCASEMFHACAGDDSAREISCTWESEYYGKVEKTSRHVGA